MDSIPSSPLEPFMEFSPNRELSDSIVSSGSSSRSLSLSERRHLRYSTSSSGSRFSILDDLNAPGGSDGGRMGLFDRETGIELQRHPDLWFPDGSIVCRAENTLFRVHSSQLGRHSVCFRDLFVVGSSHTSRGRMSRKDVLDALNANAQDGADGQTSWERLGGCPAVRLWDRAEDVANLFTSLYDGPTFGNNDKDDYRIVSGILRLATKYIIDNLRNKAIAHLSIVWPTTLKAWDTREDLARAYEVRTGGRRLYPSPQDVICLAREVDAPILLPSAFYDLSRFSFTQIFEPGEDEVLHQSRLAGRPDPVLQDVDLQRLALGKEAAQHAITSLIQAMGQSQSIRHPGTHMRKGSASSAAVCVSAAACRKDFGELVDLATQHYLFDRERGCYDPLYVAEELGQLKSAEFSECKACARSLESWATRERERMWKAMPAWFRLDSPMDLVPAAGSSK
ncbi:hypothetical protein HGRIS_004901 [Hohenbuehelia grisea]|uniref:BTB domain-containing protein n=1 Tax=Hohenbuehelia grisea TaxID=104357 RepID=A0ABR3JE89_9AGAR